MPEIGELVLKRVIVAFRKAYKRNDKVRCIACCKFIAHLVNQQVVTEILAGQILQLLLEKPTDDSVELAVAFMKECGQVLSTVAPKIVHAVFDRFRSILHEGEIDKRVQYMIENLFTIRKTEFKDFQGVIPELDLVEAEDQITHELELDDDMNVEDQLDYFHFDEDFEANEERYNQIKVEILGDQAEKQKASDSDSEDSEDEEAKAHEVTAEKLAAKTEDQTQQDLITLKRTIYLTIMSSLDFQECAHKLIKSGLSEGKEMEVSSMIIECCSQERSYLKYFGLLAQRLCAIDKVYQQKLEECFALQYGMIHRLETNKVRNVAKLYAHLLGTDAISWAVLEHVSMTQNDTTSSSRIFIKIVFQELTETMSLQKLCDRLKDPFLKEHFAGMFPMDNPKNIRFAINFWTSIGLGAITEELREHLVVATKMAAEAAQIKKEESSSSDSSSSDSSSDSSDDSSDSSDDDDAKKRRKRKSVSPPPQRREQVPKSKPVEQAKIADHKSVQQAPPQEKQQDKKYDDKKYDDKKYDDKYKDDKNDRRRRHDSYSSDDDYRRERHHRRHHSRHNEDYRSSRHSSSRRRSP